MAVIGILSDSHGEHVRTRQALLFLQSMKCDSIIHLGDIGTLEVLDECAGLPVSLVFGNCDFINQLKDYAIGIGLDVQHPVGKKTIDGISFAFLHGDDIASYQQLLDDPEVEVLLHGHTHEMRDEIVKNTRCINPGALHRAARYTIATFDTNSTTLEFHVLDE